MLYRYQRGWAGQGKPRPYFVYCMNRSLPLLLQTLRIIMQMIFLEAPAPERVFRHVDTYDQLLARGKTLQKAVRSRMSSKPKKSSRPLKLEKVFNVDGCSLLYIQLSIIISIICCCRSMFVRCAKQGKEVTKELVCIKRSPWVGIAPIVKWSRKEQKLSSSQMFHLMMRMRSIVKI